MKNVAVAVKAALAACVAPSHREMVLVTCWRNGFFGTDPFLWAKIARAIGADIGEILHARWVFLSKS